MKLQNKWENKSKTTQGCVDAVGGPICDVKELAVIVDFEKLQERIEIGIASADHTKYNFEVVPIFNVDICVTPRVGDLLDNMELMEATEICKITMGNILIVGLLFWCIVSAPPFWDECRLGRSPPLVPSLRPLPAEGVVEWGA